MEAIKKIISLNEAAKMSGYTQDYLGYLIRQGEIKGKKIGRNWFTTKTEIDEYLFKQKIRHKEFAIRGFFSHRRAIKILTIASIASVVVFSTLFYRANFEMKDPAGRQSVDKDLSEEAEVLEKISLKND